MENLEINSKEKRQAELKVQLDKFAHLFMIAKESYLYAEYFHNPETKDEIELLQNDIYYYHFRFINHILFKNLVIELAKIFSRKKSDKFRIAKFLNGFKKDGQFGDLGIGIELIQVWEIELESNNKVIETIIKFRDELYSHTDDKEIDYDVFDINFIKIKELLDFAEKIIRNIFSILFQTHFISNSPKFERERFPILKVLAIGEEKRKNDVYKEATESIRRHKNNS